MSDPGEYYERKRLEAARLRAELAAARERNAPPAELRRLERALELAYYVGD